MRESVFIGIGTTEDPFPGEPSPTRIRVCACSCHACRGPERFLVDGGGELVLECGSCGETRGTGLPASLLPEISYVFWCTRASFPSDRISRNSELDRELRRLLETLGPPEVPPPAWGVLVVAGVCMKAEACSQRGCFYHTAQKQVSEKAPRQKIRARVIPLAQRKTKGAME